MAPIDAIFSRSKIECHDSPWLVVSHTPPATVPMRYRFGLFVNPVTASTRPPPNGPIRRHFNSCNPSSGTPCASALAVRVRTENTSTVRNPDPCLNDLKTHLRQTEYVSA